MPARRLAQVNTELEKQPFVGLSLICPTAPPSGASDAVLANYCDWLERELLPRAGLLARIDATPCLGVVGHAGGAALAFEVFARKPHLFRALGAVQPRIEGVGATQLARRLARGAAPSGLVGIYLQTSAGHAQRPATRALHRELKRRSILTHLDELLGPADEASWRHAGLLSTLAWHERMLQLVEKPDPDTAPVQSDPPSKRARQRPLRT
jgi:pimeloyl-ACP methyl ester carboxylesterase